MVPLGAYLAVALIGVGLSVTPLASFVAPPGPARPPLLALAVVVVLGAALTLGWAGLAAAVLFAVAIGWAARGRPEGSPPSAPLWPLVMAGAILMLPAVVRPSLPLYWDGFVWLAKARLVGHEPGRLVTAALSGKVIPPGYPLLDSLAAGLLGPTGTQAAVTAGAAAFEALISAVFVTAVWSFGAGERRGLRTLALVVILCACPLVLIHLRAVYVDLPVGMLAAALAVWLAGDDRTLGPYVLAVALVGLKDEGLAHVGAICAVAGLRAFLHGSPRALTRAASCFGVALTACLAWRLRLKAAGVADVDHLLGWPHLARLGELGHLAGATLADLTSWGALWMLAGGALLALPFCAPSARRRWAWTAATLLAQALALTAALLCGPPRVMEFARGGTLLGRLLIQLAPAAALLVVEALFSRDAAPLGSVVAASVERESASEPGAVGISIPTSLSGPVR